MEGADWQVKSVHPPDLSSVADLPPRTVIISCCLYVQGDTAVKVYSDGLVKLVDVLASMEWSVHRDIGADRPKKDSVHLRLHVHVDPNDLANCESIRVQHDRGSV